MKRVGVLQAGYIPWLGFFELMASSDVFVIYDDVQYDKHGWRNRNRIKTLQGIKWLTVPVLTKGQNWPDINKVIVSHKRWQKKHRMSIYHAYRKAKYFDDVFPIIDNGLKLDSDNLIDIDMYFINKFASYMNIGTELYLSSSLDIFGESKADRLINICKHFGATHYYNGARGQHLYKKEDFRNHGILLEIQNYKHPAYKQLHGEFVPYLSIVDLLFNEGPSSLEIVRSGRNIL